MPEGHTIHREARMQAPLLVGSQVAAESPNRRVHPERPASGIRPGEWDRIWAAAVRMLRAGVAREPETVVYRRRMCARCGFPVRRWELEGRQAWACETCQPLSP